MSTLPLLKIGDVAKHTGVAVGALRYYESLDLLTPAERKSNGYRYYHPDAIQQVQFIKKAQTLGFSLEDIGRILAVRHQGKLPCDLVQDLLKTKIEHLESQIQQMKAFKQELEGYQKDWANIPQTEDSEAVCPLIAALPLTLEG